jgi:hypothetical protein
MGDRMRRRKQESIAADPTLAADLLGSPPSGSTAADWSASSDTEVIDSTDLAGDDEDLGRLLAERAPRKHLPWVTAGLVGAILLSAGYVAGGYHYSHQGSGGGNATGFAAARTGTGRTAEGGFGRNTNGTGAQTGTGGATTPGGGFGGAGGATIGTVKLVDGNNVYLTDSSGATVKVTLAPNASVTVTKKGKLADLTPGTAVVVVGQTGKDGTVTATTVTQGGGFGGARNPVAGTGSG